MSGMESCRILERVWSNLVPIDANDPIRGERPKGRSEAPWVVDRELTSRESPLSCDY